MTYRNYSRLALAALALVFGVAALITSLWFVAFHHDSAGQTAPVSASAAAFDVVFFLGFIVTGTGWLILRGINYDTWYRQTYPGQPLHQESTEDVTAAATWRAADRTPGI